MLISNTAESFMYSTLQHPDSFRLMKLERLSSEAEWEWKAALIEARLPLHAHAADGPKYLALSYCWGTPSCNVPEEHSIEFSPSLSTALSHILVQFAERSELYIWVDQICINQYDNREREQQVDMMRRIYRGAEQVIGWLGPAFDGSKKAMSDLVLFAIPSNGEATSQEWRQAFKQSLEYLDRDELIQYLGSVMISGSGLRGRMLKLFEMPWFSRRWIAQEACLASNLRIHCGFQSISGEQLFQALKVIQQIILPIVSPWLKRPFRNAFALLHTRDVTQDHQLLSVPYLLQRLSFLDCERDQDRINALAGIFQSETWFKPEYCPTQEMYVKFAIAHMQHYQSLEILHFAGVTEPTWHKIRNDGDQIVCEIAWPAGDLPSWVPDWRIRFRPLPMLPAGSYDVDHEQDLVLTQVPVNLAQRRLPLQGKLVNFHIKRCSFFHLDRYEPGEHSDVLYAIDNWCNSFFLNFLMGIDESLGSGYRSRASFSDWYRFLMQAGSNPEELLLRFARTVIMNGVVKSTDRTDHHVPQDKILEYFLEYAKIHFVVDSNTFGLILDDCIDKPESLEKAAAYGYLAEEVCRYRMLFVSDDGDVGLGLAGIHPSDRVCFFRGLKTPFILHPQDDHFQLRGECYIDSLRGISYDDLEEAEQEIILE